MIKTPFLSPFFLAAFFQTPFAIAAEPAEAQGNAPSPNVATTIQIGIFVLGVRYGAEAVCHWPSHHDLEFVTGYLGAIPHEAGEGGKGFNNARGDRVVAK